ncbi:DUF2637 domain-containing protein [Streptomyces sp. MI02-2A]|uniref:DUF2637 domain-containing protein n=1 Tax=unclassified Streptomyces TaxID=2593676 RepID=UPI0029BD6992|nr:MULTISPECIES: DUF2637 domain-containing protein [unclassified Streptomyces]MDX3262914.1 DUF2637 domain-containing protein [Streptomyces sp. MI02-2A]
MQRVLIAVVMSGAVVIAGIGFAGSYAAVRELAIKKGFGNFAYVFPIGIDAGICVLLALDLLLTWIRIPFPLLRQTAWLLTAATIAFNGAAAWPNPLSVGMHAVIPVLFVVAVEAARHAIGRIADITADKHMEGVRPTRWLLSPIPTLLLWRRMKLWELRSYDQVIKLEQERLVYQARLRSRFGRAWRRKAPVESLMPLRLAKYGVPLMDTTPAGLAAAGIKPASVPDTAPPVRAPAPRQHRGREAIGTGSVQAATQPRGNDLRPTLLPSAPDHLSSPRRIGAEGAEEFAGRYLDHARRHPDQLDPAGSVHEQTRTVAAGAPSVAAEDHETPRTDFQEHKANAGAASSTAKANTGPAVQASHESGADEHSPVPIPATTAVHATKEKHPAHVNTTIDRLSPPTSAEEGHLTLVDRYYLAWCEYRTQHGDEPTGPKLSAYLASKGMRSRSGKPVSPSTLRRYFLPFRLYTIWAKHRVGSSAPALEAIAHDCAAHGITAQYNKPLTIHDISEHIDDFERRWQSLTQHHTNTHQ